MTDFHTIADRVAIDALRAEFTDAAMMNDHERLADLFTPDGVVRIPDAGIEAVGREGLVALGRQREGRMDLFVQTTHPGTVRFGESGEDTASGRAYISELIRTRDGQSHRNHGIYHDTYRRTADGWKFTERVYEIRYLDTTPLGGSSPAGRAQEGSPGPATTSGSRPTA
ncbi:nuclear transport factor 2 family protein [Streptomyces sp. NRRL F-5126]|uniref:nuclear transport factor 2 family protein n=1 Tax=Streptomyces sp. NRRL F-5126 TaxID=1463857 RepID=UPI00056BD307|nr:nuclear transport factor 2 family protein [Streptomyces sp. NRRL F-5126]